MWNLKCILHPTDFSEAAANAFALACAVARDYDARLVVLHALEPLEFATTPTAPSTPPDRKSAEAELRQIQARYPEVAMEYRLAEGEPVGAILAAAREIPCELIVMGTHGRTQLRRLLLGGVAEKVVRNACCPVLTVSAPPTEAASAWQGMQSRASSTRPDDGPACMGR